MFSKSFQAVGRLLCAAVLLTAVQGALGAEVAPDAEQILQRIRFAAGGRFDSGVFTGTLREYQTAVPLDPVARQAKLDQHKAERITSLKNGIGLSENELDDLKASGFTSVQQALENPTFKALFDDHIERDVASYDRSLTIENAEKFEESKITFMTAGSDRLRKEKTIVQYTIAGKIAQAPGARIIYTVNKQSFLEHMPERKFATVHQGSGDRPGQQQTQLGRPNVLQGGNPVTVPPHWTSKQIVSSEAVETPEGKATKLVMAEPGAAGVGTTIAIWILPDRGYSVFRSESYMHGKLCEVRQYGGYKEIEAGQWYPFNQKVEHIDAVLPPDVEQKLKSGELSIASEQVLKSQIVQRSRGGELALESVKINGPIDEQQFSITMPTGTAVYDYILSRSPGMPYKYVVGEVDPQTDLGAHALNAAAPVPPTPSAATDSSRRNQADSSIPAVVLPRPASEATGRFNQVVLVAIVAVVVAVVVVLAYRANRKPAV